VYRKAETTYAKMLALFFANHSVKSPGWGTQYMSAMFYHNKEQKNECRRFIKAFDEKDKAKRGDTSSECVVKSKLKRATPFYAAEHYHQKYSLNSRYPRIVAQLKLDERAIIDSPFAAVLNATLAGHGSAEQVEKALASLRTSEPDTFALVMDAVHLRLSAR